MGLEGNSAADQEVKWGSTLSQSSTLMDLTSSIEALKWTNGVSLRIGTSAIHMPESIGYLQADNTVTSIGNEIGPGTSASLWHKYALAILRWQQLTCIVSGAETRPSADTVKLPKKQLDIWCSTVWPTIRPGGTRGLETFTTDPQRLWSYLEQIGAVTPPDREWQIGEKEYLSPAVDWSPYFSRLGVWFTLKGLDYITGNA